MDCLEGFSCQGHLGRSMCSLPRHQAGPEPRKCPVDVRGSCSGEVGEGREPNQKDIFESICTRARNQGHELSPEQVSSAQSPQGLPCARRLAGQCWGCREVLT